MSERLVVVGGGPAGLAAARSYRESGGRGRVTLLSTERHPPYRRPPLTKEYLRGKTAREDLPLQQAAWFGQNAVDLRLAVAATSLDLERRVVVTGEGELPYDACVLATGSEPVRPPVPGADDPEVLVMRTVEDSTRLSGQTGPGSRAVVVGSGFIGCEAAASLALRGAEVTLVSLDELPQGSLLGPEAGDRIRAWLENRGIGLRLGAGITGIERRDGGFAVGLDGGETISTETVLLGTGVEARTGLAERAGLEVDGGVVTDSSMRTVDPSVFAAGDIAFAYNEAAEAHIRVEHWGDALEHGRIAGSVLAGAEARWESAPGFWSTIGDRTLKYTAWSGGWDEARFLEHEPGGPDGPFTVWYGREGVCVGVLTHNYDEDYERGGELIKAGAPVPG
ncbi:MAG: FAD-dependent oxidoreductase [Rubrobacter sp.]|nr:FAD-dependent oxidoreductase [Rubrobacter sp.]